VIRIRIFLRFVVMVVVLAAGVTIAQTPRTIAISADDAMKYSVTQIVAKPGELLKVRLTATGVIPKEVMAHNFVLLQPDTKVDAFIMAAAMARDTGYIPATLKKQIIANTGLAGPGETVEITFAAPKVAGKYQYICSFAGHYQAGMTGWLIVK
jgi:azurin